MASQEKVLERLVQLKQEKEEQARKRQENKKAADDTLSLIERAAAAVNPRISVYSQRFPDVPGIVRVYAMAAPTYVTLVSWCIDISGQNPPKNYTEEGIKEEVTQALKRAGL